MLDRIFVVAHNACVPSCEVEFTEEFGQWWDSLTEEEQVAVRGHVDALQALGVSLGFPRSSEVKGSRHGHMRELRVKGGSQIRVLYAFDPRRYAILLLGGDKTGNSRWYEEFVPKADDLYDEHIATLKREGLVPAD